MRPVYSRIHLHTHKEPNGRAYIIGDRQGLLALSKALERAAKGAVGLETVQLYSSDGHQYETIIATDITEEEWQDIPVPYDKRSNPGNLESIKIYDGLRSELS